MSATPDKRDPRSGCAADIDAAHANQAGAPATLGAAPATLGAAPAPPVLQARGLCRHFVSRAHPLAARRVLHAVQQVDLDLAAGRTLAVVGESGCGKSTLARMLALLDSPSSGTLRIEGRPVSLHDRQALRGVRTRVQMVFQDPLGSLHPRQTIGQTLDEALRLATRLTRGERAERVDWMLHKVGLRSEQAQRWPHMLSGGQRQRVAIARALLLRPKVVVADEPVSALDVSVRAQVLNLLMDLGEEFQVAYLFISHDLSVVAHIADEVMVMYLGRCVEFGAREQVLRHPAHPYTRGLIAATPRLQPQADQPAGVAPTLRAEPPSPWNPPPGCAFHSRCPHASAICGEQLPRLREVDGRLVACHHAEGLPR